MKRKKIISALVIASFAFVGCNLTPAKVQKETGRVAPQVQEIAKAVSEQKISGDELADWVALIQAGNAASAPFNPYAVPVGAGLALLSAVLGVVAKKKTADAAKSNAKYQSHKQGVESTLKEMLIASEQQIRTGAKVFDKVLYEKIGEARQRNGV